MLVFNGVRGGAGRMNFSIVKLKVTFSQLICKKVRWQITCLLTTRVPQVDLSAAYLCAIHHGAPIAKVFKGVSGGTDRIFSQL